MVNRARERLGKQRAEDAFLHIHTSEHQARALGCEGNEAARYSEPDEWVRYYTTILRRYFEEFPNVGLYIAPALAKRLLQVTGDPPHAAALRRHMRDSATAYVRMFTYARQFYRAGSSMERCFNEKVKPDYEPQLAWLAARVTPE